MKTISKSIFIFLVLIFSGNVYSQIKVLSNGWAYLGTATFSVPATYEVNQYGRWFVMGGRGNSMQDMVKFDTGNTDPRIWSPSGSIVFYNSDGVGTPGYQNIQVQNCYQYSDINGKTNINTLTNSLNKIKNLRGVTYNWKNSSQEIKTDQTKPNKLEYGLIAQEVEQVVPDLVITNDSTQGKMLSYTGVIPILIEAVKELSAKIDDQKQQIEDQKQQIDLLKNNASNLKSAQIPDQIETTLQPIAFITQNTPNPFNNTTEINYYLPNEVRKAVLNIYNIQGLPIKSIPIQSTGNGSITINGSALYPGTYIYTLIADGKKIDTKRMIISK